MRRLTPGLLAAIALLALGAASVLPASGTEREAMTVKEGPATEKTFPALVGAVPQSEEDVRPNPSDCRTYLWCDTVPLDVVVPAGLTEDDGFFLTVEVRWDDAAGANDIDMFLYDDMQKAGGAGYTQVGAGASADNPERAKAFRPDLGRYNLVVLNFSGANTGYTVKGALTLSKFESPYEALAPTTTVPGDKTTATTTGPEESLEPTTTATTLAPVAATADSDFAFGRSDFAETLEGPPDFGSFGEAGDLPTNKPPSVSAATVVVSLVIVPLLLGAALGAFVLRRRRSALGLG